MTSLPTYIAEAKDNANKKFDELFSERFSHIARMADKGLDVVYGKALAKLQIDIESFLEKELTQLHDTMLKESHQNCKEHNEEINQKIIDEKVQQAREEIAKEIEHTQDKFYRINKKTKEKEYEGGGHCRSCDKRRDDISVDLSASIARGTK